MTRLTPYIIPFLMMGALLLGLFPQSADNPMMMVPFLLLSSILLFTGKIFKLPTNDTTLLILLILFLLWTISTVLSPVPFPSHVTWVILLTLPAAYILSRTTDHNPIIYLPFLCLPFAGYTIWQALHSVHRPDAPFDDANLLGLFYAFGILSALPHKKIPSILCTAILFIALILTQSRSALLCLTFGAGFYVLINTPLTTYLNKKTIFATLATLIPAATLIYVTGFTDRLTAPTGRLAIWQGAAEMLTEHPFFGFGLGTFHLYYPSYRLAGDTSLGWMAHMDFLQTAIESGWASAIALYALFAMPFVYLYQNRAALTPAHKSAGAILICFFIAMHINYPIHASPFLIILGLALALMPNKNKNPIPLITSCGLLITFLSGVWIMAQTSMTLMLFTETQTAYRLHDQKRFDTAITACINDGDKNFPDCRLMAARFLTIARDPDTNKINKLLDAAIGANPTSPEPDYLRAQMALSQTPPDTKQALSLLEHSLALNPAYWPARRLSIEILIKNKDISTARRLLENGLIYPYAKPVRDDISRIRKTLDGHQ